MSNNSSTKQSAVLKSLEDRPNLAASLSKLVYSNNKSKNKPADIDPKNLSAIHANIKQRTENIESIFQLFPDMELWVQILVSSVMSPKNMTENELYYSFNDSYVSSNVSMSILSIIKSHIEKNYSMSSKLPTILRETLFNKGSYVVAMLPESTIDEVINSGISVSSEELDVLVKEDKDSSLDLIDVSKPSIEDVEELEVTDNYELLKIPGLVKKNKEQHNHKKHYDRGYSFEDIESDIKEFYLTDNNEARTSVTITSDNKRRSIGKPLILKLPSESVIPIHVPGDPSDHAGYFVMLDEEGHPVTNKNSIDVNQDGLDKLISERSSNKLITKAKQTLIKQSIKDPTIDNMVDVFSKIVEDDLKKRLNNKNYAKNAEIASNRNLYRTMFARSLANHNTKLLFIPADLVTYYAYKYSENGTGKSLMDDLLIITSIRSILLFSRVMASVKGSIPITDVKIKLDETDPDPLKTIDKVMSEVLRTRQQSLPIGINSPVDLADWVHRAGFQFDWDGHPGLPDLHLDFDTKKFEHSAPDEDLDNMLRKQQIMTFGLTPETVDSAYDSNFATSVVSNNLMLSKRVKQIQDVFIPQVTDNVKKIILADYSLRDKIIEVLEKNSKEVISGIKKRFKVKISKDDELSYFNWISDNLINNLEVNLPTPETSTLETMTEAYGNYKDALEDSIEAWISEDILADDLIGDISSYVDPFKETIKGHFLRKWMANNNYMPELAEMTALDLEGKPNFTVTDEDSEHLKVLIEGLSEYMKKTNKTKKKSDKDLDKLENEDEESDDTAEEDTENDDSTPDDSSGDDNTAPDDTDPGDGEADLEDDL